MLYATSTGTAPFLCASDVTRSISERTSPTQPPIHVATGCCAMRSSSAASAARELRMASASRFAFDEGFANRRRPASAFVNDVTMDRVTSWARVAASGVMAYVVVTVAASATGTNAIGAKRRSTLRDRERFIVHLR